jgi:hypothetical protein
MLSCPTPTLPPFLQIPWPWQAPLWWLIWLAVMAVTGYAVRYNYRIYRDLQANIAASINRRWFGIALAAMALGVASITMLALILMPGLMSILPWGQQQAIRLSNLHCVPSSALAMASGRLRVYTQITGYTLLVIFALEMPLLFLGMVLRDKARAARSGAAGAEGASAG